MMSPSKGRAKPRAKHDSVLEIFSAAGRAAARAARLVDMSASGICFSSTEAFLVGDKIRARLRLLREGPLVIGGRVVWAKKKANAVHYGVEFDSVEKAKLKKP